MIDIKSQCEYTNVIHQYKGLFSPSKSNEKEKNQLPITSPLFTLISILAKQKIVFSSPPSLRIDLCTDFNF